MNKKLLSCIRVQGNNLSVQVKSSRHYSRIAGLDSGINNVTDLCQAEAKKGNPYYYAQFGWCYENGIGVEPDIKRHLSYMGHAATKPDKVNILK